MFIAPCNGQCGYGFRGRVPEHSQRARKCRCRRRIAVWGVSQEPAAINVLLRPRVCSGKVCSPRGGRGRGISASGVVSYTLSTRAAGPCRCAALICLIIKAQRGLNRPKRWGKSVVWCCVCIGRACVGVIDSIAAVSTGWSEFYARSTCGGPQAPSGP